MAVIKSVALFLVHPVVGLASSARLPADHSFGDVVLQRFVSRIIGGAPRPAPVDTRSRSDVSDGRDTSSTAGTNVLKDLLGTHDGRASSAFRPPTKGKRGAPSGDARSRSDVSDGRDTSSTAGTNPLEALLQSSAPRPQKRSRSDKLFRNYILKCVAADATGAVDTDAGAADADAVASDKSFL